MKITVPLSFLLLLIACNKSLPPSNGDYNSDIRLNQVGYYPDAPKKAILVNAPAGEFHLVNSQNQEIHFSGQLSEAEDWELSGETIRVADFSAFSSSGEYQLYVEGVGYSYPFRIKKNVLAEAFTASLKALYYQRASMPLEEKYAGQWKRAAGHPDESVRFHPSVGKAGTISSPGGWYDAGDYGKYVVNGAFPLGQLLLLYEQYPQVMGDGTLNIPESGNGISDLLDELKYEMDWLLTMQDKDGGVYFKLTTETFEGMVLPEEATKQRYLFKKSTTATLDFAAVAAKFSRSFAQADPAYSEKSLAAAVKAWKWAVENPASPFKNPEGVITGQYGDENYSQEFYWAAAELYVTTKNQEYLDYLKSDSVSFGFSPGESWANFMHYLGAFALIQEESELAGSLTQEILEAANDLVQKTRANAYFQPIDDFQWGSNSDVMNTAMIIAQAYRLDPQPEYLLAVQEITDYVFGKNATGYSFVTGFGNRTPQFIHHRPSAGDEVAEPVPGLISGGPNSRKQDASDVDYPEDAAPMKCWADQEPSYASNEICLNWNAPLTYVLGFLEQESNR